MKRDYGREFKELVESVGYELLEEYKGANVKVKIRCNKGHEYGSTTPDSFKSGTRCPKCSRCCLIQAKKEFLELVESEEYKLIGEYVNAKTKVKIRCNKGHEYSTTPHNFKNSNRCPECPCKSSIQAEKDFIELVESVGYELLEEYKNSYTKVKIRCNEGHEYKVIPDGFKRGTRCPECFERRSQKEIYILNYVRSILNEEVISGDRTHIINPRTGNFLELDIWIPSLRKAIEFNGTYWHSDEYTRYKDDIKREYCEANNIDLKVIEELEYDTELELCLGNIDNFLGIEKTLYEYIFGIG